MTVSGMVMQQRNLQGSKMYININSLSWYWCQKGWLWHGCLRKMQTHRSIGDDTGYVCYDFHFLFFISQCIRQQKICLIPNVKRGIGVMDMDVLTEQKLKTDITLTTPLCSNLPTQTRFYLEYGCENNISQGHLRESWYWI